MSAEPPLTPAAPAAPLPRLDGPDKVTGRARYVDDLVFPGLLHGLTIRSTVPRGRIRTIAYDPSIPWNEFTIVTAEDIPGANEVLLIVTDQPFLVRDEVRHDAEAILLLAHPDPEALRRAGRAITIEYDELPACLDVRLSGRPEYLQYGADNTFHRIDITKGDVEAGFEAMSTVGLGRQGQRRRAGARKGLGERRLGPGALLAESGPASLQRDDLLL